MKKICSVYCFTNQINNKKYIGSTIVEPNVRYNQHKYNATHSNTHQYNYPLYQAFRKYGMDNFEFKILEECEEGELKEKEIFYISLYNTYINGYNETPGGDGVLNNQGERHPHTKLTNEDVYYIREQYAAHKD